MPTLDVFNNDVFNMSGLTATIDKVPFVPGAAGKLGIFNEKGVYTTTIEIEERAGTLYLIPNTPRSAPILNNSRDKRTVRLFKNLHLPVQDNITADEIQNKRAFGSETDLQMAQDEVDTRLKKMRKGIDATVEFGRISALQGVILDANGVDVIYNLYNEFGVVQISEDFDLGNAASDILSHCENVRGAIQDELGADGSEDIEVEAFVGKTFFQRLVSHPNVKTAYQYYQTVQQAQNPLQRDLRYMGFKFGDITFRVYRGTSNGTSSGTPFVPLAQGTAFPTSVPDLYETFYSPANYMETANTKGRPVYAKMAPDPSGFNKFWQVEAQTNPLSLCLRPRVLINLRTGS